MVLTLFIDVCEDTKYILREINIVLRISFKHLIDSISLGSNFKSNDHLIQPFLVVIFSNKEVVTTCLYFGLKK